MAPTIPQNSQLNSLSKNANGDPDNIAGSCIHSKLPRNVSKTPNTDPQNAKNKTRTTDLPFLHHNHVPANDPSKTISEGAAAQNQNMAGPGTSRIVIDDPR